MVAGALLSGLAGPVAGQVCTAAQLSTHQGITAFATGGQLAGSPNTDGFRSRGWGMGASVLARMANRVSIGGGIDVFDDGPTGRPPRDLDREVRAASGAAVSSRLIFDLARLGGFVACAGLGTHFSWGGATTEVFGEGGVVDRLEGGEYRSVRLPVQLGLGWNLEVSENFGVTPFIEGSYQYLTTQFTSTETSTFEIAEDRAWLQAELGVGLRRSSFLTTLSWVKPSEPNLASGFRFGIGVTF